MDVVNLSTNNSLLTTFLSQMRNAKIQVDSMRFRRNIERIGEIMAYEISRTLSYIPQQISTPLADMLVPQQSDKVVLATILRAGLPMHQGMLNYFDDAENAFVSAYREYTDESHTNVRINVEYLASPLLDDKVLIVADPMLATGGSMELALRALLTKGKPRKIHLCSILATPQAIDLLKRELSDYDITLWVAAIDKTLNRQKYIVPGLGDAGDLAFGEKQ